MPSAGVLARRNELKGKLLPNRHTISVGGSVSPPMRSMKGAKLAILVTILAAGVVTPGVAKDRGVVKDIRRADSRDRKGKEGGQRRQAPQQGPKSGPTQKANDNKKTGT